MDNYVKYLSADGFVRLTAIDSTEIARQAESVHQTSAVTTAALGRLLTAASMLGALQKGEHCSLTLRLCGNGPAGTLIAVSDALGNVRGYVENPVVELPLNPKGKLDVAGAVGHQGTLYVVQDLGMREPYSGQTPIVSGEIAEDIAHYFVLSEQTPTVCSLGVLVNPDLTVATAGGFLLQLLPGAPQEHIALLEGNIDILPSISTMLMEGNTPQEIAQLVMAGLSPSLLEQRALSYCCDCSRQRMERAVASLGIEELTEMSKEPQNEVCCQFCSRREQFSREDLLALIQQRKAGGRA